MYQICYIFKIFHFGFTMFFQVTSQDETHKKQIAEVSPALPAQKEEVASEIVTDIIEDVLNSTTVEPSVASVVFDTFKDFVTPEEPNEVDKDKYGVNVSGSIAAGEEKVLDESYAKIRELKEHSLKEAESLTSEVGTVVINGHVITSNADTSSLPSPSVQQKNEKNKSPETHENVAGHTPQLGKKKERAPPVPNSLSPAIPQTDLDTFETRMSNEVSNLNEDSDKKSDSGSVNTSDSIGDIQDQDNDAGTPQVQKRHKKDQARSRSVSIVSVFVFCLGWKFLTPFFSTCSKLISRSNSGPL